MKKWIAMLLALAMLLSLAACAKTPTADNTDTPAADNTPADTETPETPDDSTETPETPDDSTETPAEPEAPVVDDAPASGEEPSETPSEGDNMNNAPTGDSTVGQVLLMDFRDKMQQDPAQTALTLAQEIAQNPAILFACDSAPCEEGWLNGFDEDITGFAECASFGPIIGSIPFCGYIFKLADGADVDAFVENLKAHANLRWNICTEADEMLVEAQGSTVFFLMAPYSLED